MAKAKHKLTIKDGKFYRNGREEKAEFGNREQIQLLKEIQWKSDIWHKGIQLKKAPAMVFKCSGCKSDVVAPEKDNPAYKGTNIECPECYELYELVYRPDIDMAKAFRWVWLNEYLEKNNNE